MRASWNTLRRPALLALLGVLAGTAEASAATLHVAPGGGSSGCTAVAPCGSIEAAYRRAAPGDVIRVAGGTYGKQTLPAPGRSGPAIEVVAAPGARVSVDGLDVRADNVVVRGLRSTSFLDVEGTAANPVEHVRLHDVHTRRHWVSGARDFTWSGGSIGPNHNETPHKIGGTPASHRLTYDRILWHDATRDASDVHIECLLALGTQGLTIRNSRFTNCAVFDILISRILDDPPPRDLLIENTVLEASKDVDGSNGYYTLMTGEDEFDGFVLRNNVWDLALSLPGPLRRARIVGNVGKAASCRDGVRYSRNVFTDRRCGATDRVSRGAFSDFVNPEAGDWRLRPGAAAVDAGDASDHPAADAEGCPRDAGRAPDAGAYELGAAAPCRSAGGRPPPAAGEAILRRRARALRVIDGATLRVRLRGSGRRLKVRLRGIAAPARCGARPARRALGRLTSGRPLVLVFPRRAARDGRGRVPATVSVQGADVGRRLLAAGRARLSSSTVPRDRRAAYVDAERRARQADRGVWRACRG